MGWRRGCFSMATAGLGAWTLSPELLPGFDNLPGVLSATSKHLNAIHLLSSMALEERPERRGRTAEQGLHGWRVEMRQKTVLWDSVRVLELYPQLLLPRGSNLFG